MLLTEIAANAVNHPIVVAPQGRAVAL